MKKMTLDDLRKLRGEKQQALSRRDPDNRDVQIVVGMATCGIAAGAKEAFAAILDEVESEGLNHVLVRQTGCMGLCHSEPTVEVSVPDMPTVIYGKVDAELGRRIVLEHVKGRRLIDNAIFDRPATDIVTE